MGSDERIRTARSSGPHAVQLGSEGGCEEWSQELTLFVDGELDDADRAVVETHLGACQTCRAAARWQQAFRDSIRTKFEAATAGPAPLDLKARLRTALAAEPVVEAAPPAPAPPARNWMAPLRRFLSPMPVAAGVGATALGITAWLWASPRASDDVVKDLVARHSRQLPLEVQTNDPRSLEQWLNGKVDFRVKIPKLAGKPLNLVGARLSHVKDQAAVHLLYGTPQSPQHQVSMLVFDASSRGTLPAGAIRRIDDHDVYIANRAGYNVAIWKDNEVVYSLVSDTEDDVLDLVRAAANR